MGGLGRQELIDRGWTIEVTALASTLDAAAVLSPFFAALATSRTGRVVAIVSLIPAVLICFPAAPFIGGAWKGFAAPVAILDEAVGRLKAKSLLCLSRSNLKRTFRRGAGIDWGSKLGEWQGQWCRPDVVGHGIIAHMNVSWNGDSVLRGSVARRGKEYLGAARIELRICRGLVCLVQS